jgi:hypothetical protein
MALRLLDRPARALEALREALKAEQRLPAIRFAALSERSRTYESTGNLVAARRELKRILDENPLAPGIRSRWEALRGQGDD